MTITNQQLHAIMPTLAEPKRTLILDGLNAAMDKYGMNGDDRKDTRAMFLAQVAHESGEGRYLEEIASGQAYEGRKDLGNTEPGDGRKYKGRGMVQVTGRANYSLISKDLGVDFVANPEKLAEPGWACMSACWFWTTHNLSNVIAQLGLTKDAFEVITKKINGGLNGWDSRQMYWERAKKALA